MGGAESWVFSVHTMWPWAGSMEFSRQEYKSGSPFPTPRDFPDPGTEPPSLGRRILYHFVTWEVPCCQYLLPAEILAFSAYWSWMKNMETEFGGNRKVAFILSWRRGEHSRLTPEELCPHPHPRSTRSLGAYVKQGLAVRSQWWGIKVIGSWFLPLVLFQRQS